MFQDEPPYAPPRRWIVWMICLCVTLIVYDEFTSIHGQKAHPWTVGRISVGALGVIGGSLSSWLVWRRTNAAAGATGVVLQGVYLGKTGLKGENAFTIISLIVLFYAANILIFHAYKWKNRDSFRRIDKN